MWEPQQEEKVLEFWDKNNIFQKSLDLSNIPFNVVDGPPFANSTPHIGHCLVSTCKDMIGRRKTQEGLKVIRINGMDCHGVPVEMAASKILDEKQIKNPSISEKNLACSELVKTCLDKWPKYLTRIGRWSDYKNGYATMNLNYMETTWAIFKMLYERDLIYRGKKIVHFSTGCQSALSNFEATLNMKEVTDPTITVGFKLKNIKNTYILIWTTTPWTLPANMALCVNRNMKYFILRKDKYIIISQSCYNKRDKSILDLSGYILCGELMGSDLEGLKYEPIFKKSVNKIFADQYVDENFGTGIVHLAPAHGEEDFQVCMNNNIQYQQIIDIVGSDGKYIRGNELKGRYIKDKDTTKKILLILDRKGVLFNRSNVKHNIGYCWRTDTPLIYKLVDAWFVRTTAIKDDLIRNNSQINWIPKEIGSNKMHEWLSHTKDWCISRDRWWGTPIPIWTDGKEIKCIGSIKELGDNINDIHIDKIDNIQVLSDTGKELKRVNGVLDCWFESGCAPYGQLHYPFENVDLFNKSFPADFVIESTDQTRGWFYTLLVISTALFNKPPFKNVIVTGMVLSEKGEKISKKLGNYSDTMELVQKYGADNIRMYLIDSSVVRAGELKFNIKGVKEIIRLITIPLWMGITLWCDCLTKHKLENKNIDIPSIDIIYEQNTPLNKLNWWVLYKLDELYKFVNDAFSKYELWNLVTKIMEFVQILNNDYIRLIRTQLKTNMFYIHILYKIYHDFCVILAPIAPFISELIYNKLRILNPNTIESVHLVQLNEIKPINPFPQKLLREIEMMNNILRIIRNIRNKLKIDTLIPINIITIYTHINMEQYTDMILEEINGLTINWKKADNIIEYEYNLNIEKYKNTDLDKKKIGLLKKTKLYPNINIDGIIITEDLLDKKIIPKLDTQNVEWNCDINNELIITIEKNNNTNMELYELRKLKTEIQKMRKESKLRIWDTIKIFISIPIKIDVVINNMPNYIIDLIQFIKDTITNNNDIKTNTKYELINTKSVKFKNDLYDLQLYKKL